MPPNAIRNFQITQSYHEIGLLFSQLLRANTTTNWPTMASWASQTVGIGIRKEMLPHWIDAVLAKWPKWVRNALKFDSLLIDKIFHKILEEVSLPLSGIRHIPNLYFFLIEFREKKQVNISHKVPLNIGKKLFH